MQPNSQNDCAPAAANGRGAKNASLDGLQKKYTFTRQEVKPSRAAILRAWADYLTLIAIMLARREPVSRAGQSCVMHVADLLREEAEVPR